MEVYQSAEGKGHHRSAGGKGDRATDQLGEKGTGPPISWGKK